MKVVACLENNSKVSMKLESKPKREYGGRFLIKAGLLDAEFDDFIDDEILRDYFVKEHNYAPA